MALEEYFSKFRKEIIGIDQEFDSPFGKHKLVYADWIASGRLYHPIENILLNKLLLYNPYFLLSLIILSFGFSTISTPITAPSLVIVPYKSLT